MKCLITGITGFAGSHLAEFLLGRDDCEVHGIIRWRSRTENIDGIRNRLALHICDLRDATSINEVIARVRPERVYHLAAQSFVPMSWNAPAETLYTNVIGQTNLFEAIRAAGLTDTCRVQIAGSSEEYGLVRPEETPIKETNPLRPLSPYGVSKVAQDLMGYQYHQSYGLKVIRTRGFNHTGPRRGEVFASSNFARQIALIESGKQEPVISVGNLDAVRDFTDVRDTVRAYWLVIEKGEPGDVYNVATGKGWRIGAMLDILLGMAKVKVEVKPDPARMRPSDVELLLGDPAKLKAQTGWEPGYEFEQTMTDLLEYWRGRV
ncbi:MAG TPA: SDR family oxidoreductase [candidate division WOR-3 bacterium]|uniref:GDP-mannose 4,6-dehydratase n=1 Tax=candidate division WOR-3 bacterium TaxID=2052148 RepID=A0A7V0T788_UNCW3|nr:SDR family oxidoreductase [candidate division WOR-3 bacterium]